MAAPVYERAYAQPLANGQPAPTMDWMNPQWAQFFDRMKAAGLPSTQRGEGPGIGQSMPVEGGLHDAAAVGYDQGLDTDSMNYDSHAAAQAAIANPAPASAPPLSAQIKAALANMGISADDATPPTSTPSQKGLAVAASAAPVKAKK